MKNRRKSEHVSVRLLSAGLEKPIASVLNETAERLPSTQIEVDGYLALQEPLHGRLWPWRISKVLALVPAMGSA